MKNVVEGIIEVAAEQLKKKSSFKQADAQNLKLKKKPARPTRKGVNPITNEPYLCQAKPTSKTIRALPVKKLCKMPESDSSKTLRGINQRFVGHPTQ